MYVDEYVPPMTERNAYRIMPVGLYHGTPTPETYRALAGNLTYRYFLPARLSPCSAALLLARLAEAEASANNRTHSKSYVDLAYRQLEWIMGANPFSACLMVRVCEICNRTRGLCA